MTKGLAIDFTRSLLLAVELVFLENDMDTHDQNYIPPIAHARGCILWLQECNIIWPVASDFCVWDSGTLPGIPPLYE